VSWRASWRICRIGCSPTAPSPCAARRARSTRTVRRSARRPFRLPGALWYPVATSWPARSPCAHLLPALAPRVLRPPRAPPRAPARSPPCSALVGVRRCRLRHSCASDRRCDPRQPRLRRAHGVGERDPAAAHASRGRVLHHPRHRTSAPPAGLGALGQLAALTHRRRPVMRGAASSSSAPACGLAFMSAAASTTRSRARQFSSACVPSAPPRPCEGRQAAERWPRRGAHWAGRRRDPVEFMCAHM